MNPDKLISERKAQGHTQLSLAKLAGISERTLARLEQGEGTGIDIKTKVAKALEKQLDFFCDTRPPPSDAECTQIVRTLRIAAYHAVMAARAVVFQNSRPARVPQHARKITDKDSATDPTEPVDHVTAEAIKGALDRAARVAGHPLASGYVFAEEESGVTDKHGPEGTAPRWIIVADPADDTAAMSIGLAGTVLLSAYRKGFGWVAAVACDFVRMRLFSRIVGKSANALQLSFDPRDALRLQGQPPPPDEDPSGATVDIGPTRTKRCKDAAVCLYLGKPERVIQAAEMGKALLTNSGIKAVHSYGGSRGALLVAEGSLDAAMEYSKGFKRLDFIPGLFIADGAGCTVLLAGRDGCQKAHFGCDELMEGLFDPGKARERLIEQGRERFIVAATCELANEIAAHLKWQ